MGELPFFGVFLQDPALISCHCHSILYPPHLPLFCCYGNSRTQCLIWNHIVGCELNHSSTSRSLSSVRMGCIRRFFFFKKIVNSVV